MTKYLFLYSTTDGHTKRICEYIGNILKQQNHEIKIDPISLELKKLSEYFFEKINKLIRTPISPPWKESPPSHIKNIFSGFMIN